MNGHSTNEHSTSANNKLIPSHPHDWHRAIKVSKVLFIFFRKVRLKTDKKVCDGGDGVLFCFYLLNDSIL
jgi:hypothetical protein